MKLLYVFFPTEFLSIVLRHVEGYYAQDPKTRTVRNLQWHMKLCCKFALQTDKQQCFAAC